MSKTPGPWIEFADKGDTIAILPAGREGTVCEFKFPFPSRADARLIAAAPSLLEALTKLMSGLDGIEQLPSSYYSEAYAAIARARGEA